MPLCTKSESNGICHASQEPHTTRILPIVIISNKIRAHRTALSNHRRNRIDNTATTVLCTVLKMYIAYGKNKNQYWDTNGIYIGNYYLNRKSFLENSDIYRVHQLKVSHTRHILRILFKTKPRREVDLSNDPLTG